MKTQFGADQLDDPEVRYAAAQLRKCVHCGFCLATCPTYSVVGNELDSPRGRIVLMQDLLEREQPSAAVTEHVDRCLTCLACQTTCPSDVDYMHLVDLARQRLEPHRRWPERVFRRLLGALLARPAWFRVALAAAPPGRWLAPVLPATIRAMVDLAPTNRVRRWSPRSMGVGDPVPRPEQPQVALLVGCVQAVLDADVHDAAVRVLRALGARVVVVRGLGCCGAVAHHLGQREQSMARIRANVRALGPHLPHLTAIVSTVAGCGTMLEDVGHLLQDDPLANDAARVSELACDVMEAVELLGLPETVRAKAPLRVAYHAACSLQHGQRVRDLPQALLRRLGHRVVEPLDPHACCGSAGTYNVLQPVMAAELGGRKAASLQATEPDVVAAGNVGCALQLAPRVPVEVLHPIQLVDQALRASGPGASSPGR